MKKDDRSITILIWVFIFIIGCMFGFVCYLLHELDNAHDENFHLRSRCEDYESLRESDVEDMKEYIYELSDLSMKYNKVLEISPVYDLIFDQPTSLEEYPSYIQYYPLIYDPITYKDSYLSMSGRITDIKQEDDIYLVDVAIDDYSHQILTIQCSRVDVDQLKNGDYVRFYGKVSAESFVGPPDIICDYIEQWPEPIKQE